MDISDGLSTDLNRLCKASNCGARLIDFEITGDMYAVCQQIEKDPIELILHGGEDYQLLTVSIDPEEDVELAAGKQHVAIEQTEIVLQVFKDGQFIEYALKAAEGTSPSAEFSAIDEELCNMLTSEDLRGRLNVTIEGQAYQGVIEHHAHDHEDHEASGR
jgi:hypothetical protein